MEPYEQEQWEQLGRRLAEAEKQLLATANLVRAGVPILTSQQMRIDALIDSDARLYLHMQQIDEKLKALAESLDEKLGGLAESLDVKLGELVESQKRTDEKLARLADSQHYTDEVVVRLADSVQKLVDSWKSGGNGAH